MSLGYPSDRKGSTRYFDKHTIRNGDSTIIQKCSHILLRMNVAVGILAIRPTAVRRPVRVGRPIGSTSGNELAHINQSFNFAQRHSHGLEFSAAKSRFVVVQSVEVESAGIRTDGVYNSRKERRPVSI